MGPTVHSTDPVVPQLAARHVVVTPATELDCSSGPELVCHFVDLVASEPPLPITIDLSSIDFIDAAGMRALFECRAIADRVGRSVRFVDPSPAVCRLAALFDDVALLFSGAW